MGLLTRLENELRNNRYMCYYLSLSNLVATFFFHFLMEGVIVKIISGKNAIRFLECCQHNTNHDDIASISFLLLWLKLCKEKKKQ